MDIKLSCSVCGKRKLDKFRLNFDSSIKSFYCDSNQHISKYLQHSYTVSEKNSIIIFESVQFWYKFKHVPKHKRYYSEQPSLYIEVDNGITTIVDKRDDLNYHYAFYKLDYPTKLTGISKSKIEKMLMLL